MCKYIVVTGGVISGIGKGVVSAGLGTILQTKNQVTHIKIDPYLNVDAGNIGPAEHGEVFVTADGTEVDLDIGHYERCQNITLTRAHSITTGRVYQQVIEKERRGDYLGQTVQVVPHVIEEIQREIRQAADVPMHGKLPEYCIVELGGTIGDIEAQIFIEALSQMSTVEEMKFIHVTLVPFVYEHKTKPTQHSVKKLRESGISPDLIVCRAASELPESTIKKIKTSCRAEVLTVVDTHNLYRIPHVLFTPALQNVLQFVSELELEKWQEYAVKFDAYYSQRDSLPKLLIAGKYSCLDAYKSLIKAIEVAMLETDTAVNVQVVNVDDDPDYSQAAGIIVAGGFGARGFQGKVRAVTHARTLGIPFLGICYGFQAAICDFAESFLHSSGTESILEWATDDESMVLGNQRVTIEPETLAARLYGTHRITERERHRWKMSTCLKENLQEHGYQISGTSEIGVEIIERPQHRFFIATQFHPEFTSKLFQPHPLFTGLLRACS